MLHAESVENADLTVIHSHRDAEMKFPQRPTQVFSYLLVEIQLIGYVIELLLCHLKSIGSGVHFGSSSNLLKFVIIFAISTSM
jgi:hypothetical protein